MHVSNGECTHRPRQDTPHTSFCSLFLSLASSSSSASHAEHDASSTKGLDEPTNGSPPDMIPPPPEFATAAAVASAGVTVLPAAPPRAPPPKSPMTAFPTRAGVRGPYLFTRDRCTPLGTATTSFTALLEENKEARHTISLQHSNAQDCTHTHWPCVLASLFSLCYQCTDR